MKLLKKNNKLIIDEHDNSLPLKIEISYNIFNRINLYLNE